MTHRTATRYSAVRHALPLLLGLLLLAAPQGHTSAPLLAGDDTKVGTGGG